MPLLEPSDARHNTNACCCHSHFPNYRDSRRFNLHYPSPRCFLQVSISIYVSGGQQFVDSEVGKSGESRQRSVYRNFLIILTYPLNFAIYFGMSSSFKLQVEWTPLADNNLLFSFVSCFRRRLYTSLLLTQTQRPRGDQGSPSS